MSLVEKDGSDYVDGGVTTHIPVQYAIDADVDEIDVIVHRKEVYDHQEDKDVSNVLELLNKVIDSMMSEISRDDVSMSKLQGSDKDIEINFYFMPEKLTDNSLMFDKEVMNGWWDMGYKGVKENTCKVEKYKLTKNNNLIKK